jgi:hypothetical protein
MRSSTPETWQSRTAGDVRSGDRLEVGMTASVSQAARDKAERALKLAKPVHNRAVSDE